MPDLSKMTLYQILGVPRSASESEIKIAYRDLARIYHPDSNYYSDLIDTKPTPESIKKFELITLAYETLIDTKSRGEYDLKLTAKEATPISETKAAQKITHKNPIKAKQISTTRFSSHDLKFIAQTLLGAIIGTLSAFILLFAKKFIF